MALLGGLAWLCYMALHGYVTWPYMALLGGLAWLCYMALHGYVTWPCMALLGGHSGVYFCNGAHVGLELAKTVYIGSALTVYIRYTVSFAGIRSNIRSYTA